jgi:hypothetical protein
VRCLSLALAISFLPGLAQAKDLDQAVFDKLVTDLGNNNFFVRQAASNALNKYVDPSNPIRLNVAQLNQLRVIAIGAPGDDLEVRTRAQRVMETWARLNPKTVQDANKLLNGLKFSRWSEDLGCGDREVTCGQIKIGFGTAAYKFVNRLTGAYLDAYSQTIGVSDSLVPALKKMKMVVQGLTPVELAEIAFYKGGDRITEDDFIKYLDEQIKTATDLLQKVNESIGDPPPGGVKPVPVNGTGQIGNDKTFQIVLNGGTVTPGNVTFIDMPCSFVFTPAPMGYAYAGSMFDLSADSALQVDGSEVDVSFTYGDPALLGLPSSEAGEFQLVRFADGEYQPFLSSYNDTSKFAIQAVYDAPPAGSGLDPFGQFAILAPDSHIDLGDGVANFLLNGTGTTEITASIPQQYCNGGSCTLAQGSATGTGVLYSSGTYTLSSPSNAPFYLLANDDGSFSIVQTDKIALSYTSPQGTLMGSVQLGWLPQDDNNFRSAVVGAVVMTGGTFARYFPNGSDVNATLEFSADLNGLVDGYGFVTAGFQNAALEAGCAEQSSRARGW